MDLIATMDKESKYVNIGFVVIATPTNYDEKKKISIHLRWNLSSRMYYHSVLKQRGSLNHRDQLDICNKSEKKMESIISFSLLISYAKEKH